MDETAHLKKQVERLQASVEELGALNQIATAVGSAISLDEMNEKIVQLVVKRTRAEQGAVFLLSEEEDSTMKTMVRVQDSGVASGPARFGMTAAGWVIKKQSPLCISAEDDPDGLLRHTTGEVHSVLSVPMKSRGAMLGTLTVFNKRGAANFSESDQRFLSIVAAQSAQVIEKMRHIEVEKNLSALKKELSVASEIQLSFMPREFPELSDYDIFATNVQADEVGGDSFDLQPIDKDRLLISQGDVCGHGIPAALLMAMAQTAIRSQLEAFGGALPPLGEFVTGVSNYIQRNSERNRFMTMFIAVLNLREHTLEYVRAGHPVGLVCDNSGAITELDKGGLPLGIIHGAQYESETVSLRSGSRLLMYSDGITELENSSGEQFGDERLCSALSAENALDSKAFCDALSDILADYRGKRPQDDDITLLSLRRK